MLAGSVLADEGTCWLVPRIAAYARNMGVVGSNVHGVLLAANYYTVFNDTLLQGDTLYTMGLGDGYYSPDSGSADTTVLYLDGYVEQNIQVEVYFFGTTAEALFLWVEQGLMFNVEAADSSDTHDWNYGLWVTDTLFYDSLDTTLDTLHIATVSGEGDISRRYSDNFELIAPAMRIGIANIGSDTLFNDIHIQLYTRHREIIMSGSAGRDK